MLILCCPKPNSSKFKQPPSMAYAQTIYAILCYTSTTVPPRRFIHARSELPGRHRGEAPWRPGGGGGCVALVQLDVKVEQDTMVLNKMSWDH